MKLTIKWLAVTILALSTSGCFWMLTGGDKSKFPDGTYREMEDGRIEVTSKVTPIEGITLREGAIVSFSIGTLTSIKTAQPLALNNAKVPAGSTIKFRKRGRRLWIDSTTLGETVSYGALEFRKGSVLTFDDEGTPKYAMLRASTPLKASNIEPRRRFGLKMARSLEPRPSPNAQQSAKNVPARAASAGQTALLSPAPRMRAA